MRRVEAFHHLDVCADWNEREALTLARKGPKPLELFYVPLIWSSMLLHPAIGKQCEEALATLGDAKDFGDARRSTWKDVMLSCCYWRHIFSGWDAWTVILGCAIADSKDYEKYFTTTDTPVALHFGNPQRHGMLPHIPDQDAILNLCPEVKVEVEASIHALFSSGSKAPSLFGSKSPLYKALQNTDSSLPSILPGTESPSPTRRGGAEFPKPTRSPQRSPPRQLFEKRGTPSEPARRRAAEPRQGPGSPRSGAPPRGSRPEALTRGSM